MQAGSDSDEDGAPTKPIGQWSKKKTGLVGSMTPSFSKPVLTAEDKDILDSLTTAYSYYKLFQLDSFVNYVFTSPNCVLSKRTLPRPWTSSLVVHTVHGGHVTTQLPPLHSHQKDALGGEAGLLEQVGGQQHQEG